MIESTSRAFLEILDPVKDRLFSLASAAAPSHTEMCLQRSVRNVFELFHTQNLQPAAVVDRVEAQLRQSAPGGLSDEVVVSAMPAAIWARLAAAVQIDAAKLGGATEQSMLEYDPLLAPRKKGSPDDGSDGFNLSPWSRFVVAAAVVLIVGIAASVILTTRHATPPIQKPAATRAAATQSGSIKPPGTSRPAAVVTSRSDP